MTAVKGSLSNDLDRIGRRNNHYNSHVPAMNLPSPPPPSSSPHYHVNQSSSSPTTTNTMSSSNLNNNSNTRHQLPPTSSSSPSRQGTRLPMISHPHPFYDVNLFMHPSGMMMMPLPLPPPPYSTLPHHRVRDRESRDNNSNSSSHQRRLIDTFLQFNSSLLRSSNAMLNRTSSNTSHRQSNSNGSQTQSSGNNSNNLPSSSPTSNTIVNNNENNGNPSSTSSPSNGVNNNSNTPKSVNMFANNINWKSYSSCSSLIPSSVFIVISSFNEKTEKKDVASAKTWPRFSFCVDLHFRSIGIFIWEQEVLGFCLFICHWDRLDFYWSCHFVSLHDFLWIYFYSIFTSSLQITSLVKVCTSRRVKCSCIVNVYSGSSSCCINYSRRQESITFKSVLYPRSLFFSSFSPSISSWDDASASSCRSSSSFAFLSSPCQSCFDSILCHKSCLWRDTCCICSSSSSAFISRGIDCWPYFDSTS